MAHADYDCCAVCDSKIRYNSTETGTKDEICVDCRKALTDAGYNCNTPDDFIACIQLMTNTDALRLLHKLNFQPCYYPNVVDAFLIERGLVLRGTDGSVTGRWGKKLAPLPLEGEEEADPATVAPTKGTVPAHLAEMPVGSINNYYGRLRIRVRNSQPQWSIEDQSGATDDWEDIPDGLFTELYEFALKAKP